jgi:carboxymethylenebutenolidase
MITREDIIAQFGEHIQAELDGDLDRTMATMTNDPHLNHIPTGAGGVGYDGVKAFYSLGVPSKSFFPPDTEMIQVSKTVDKHQLVDEIIFCCTHTHEISWMLPGIAPTGKRIEVPLVVIVGLDAGKVTHEHIYWDQASVLAQIGLLDPALLPGVGSRQANLMKDLRKRLKFHYMPDKEN